MTTKPDINTTHQSTRKKAQENPMAHGLQTQEDKNQAQKGPRIQKMEKPETNIIPVHPDTQKIEEPKGRKHG